MTFVGIHVVTYLAVNALLVAIWLLTTGSLDRLSDIAASPTSANREGFWPVWSILGWGTVLVIHLSSHVWLRTVRGLRWVRREAPPVVRRLAQRSARGARWTAVMFTDIVDSTALNEQIGDSAWSRRLAEHRGLVRKVIGEHGGVEVGTAGDGFLARFNRPETAVDTALELQERTTSDPGDPPLLLRIGIHAGEAVHEGGDVVGQVVNLASRVTEVAAPGEILVTEQVADHAGPSTGIPVEFTDRGIHELKGIRGTRHLLAAHRVGAPEVGSTS